MPIKRIREQKVNAHLLIYSFLFIELTLRFGLDFEFGLGLTFKARVRVWVRFRAGVRDGIASFLFLHLVTVASAISKSI